MHQPTPGNADRGEVLIPVLADLGTDHRSHKLAASLKRLGYAPVLLADRPLHPLGKAWQGFDVRILTPRSHYRGFLSAFLIFLFRLTPILLTTRSRLWIVEDLPPLLWTALLGRLRGARVIYDAREIILETPMIRERPLRRWLWGMWHGAGLALVDTLFAVGPTAQEYYRRRYPRKRILQLPNVPFRDPGAASASAEAAEADAAEASGSAAAGSATPAEAAAPASGIPSPPASPSARAVSPPPPGGSRLVFQGAMRWGTGLPETLRALARSPGRSLTLYGFGPETDGLRALAASLGLLDRVRFAGTVPFEELHGLLAGYPGYHMGVHMMLPAMAGYDLTLANKIFDYVHAGLPVLLGPTTANRDLVARRRIGAVAASESEADILAALDELEAGWEGYRLACREAREAWCWEAFEPNIAAALAGGPGDSGDREL